MKRRIHIYTQERLQNRILRMMLVEGDCWEWQGYLNKKGYGIATYKLIAHGKPTITTAQRLSYLAFYGNLPANLDIDHLCKNRKCVNPEHLEAVTHKENVLRSDSPSAKNALKTHCAKGHVLFPKIVKGKQVRRCKPCTYASWRKSLLKRRATQQNLK